MPSASVGRSIAALVLLGCLLTPPAAPASERSIALTSRGLVAFHAENYAAALDLFDQAVSADPDDVSARYYRAAARAHLGDYDGAITDLRAVLAAQPDFNQAALDLGAALVEQQQYREALPWLEQAQRADDLAARASLFLGLAQLRLGDRAAARQSFERAERDPEHRLAASYYQGVLDYQEGRWVEAQERFVSVAETSPDSAVGREARAFLTKLGGGRRYQLYGSVGLLYDSNVILAPTGNPGAAENILGVSNQGDGLVALAVGGTVLFWQGSGVELSGNYDFFQSLHFQLHDFDLQDNGPSLQIAASVGPARVGLMGRYDYYLLEAQSFLQSGTAYPWASVALGDVGRTEIYYLLRRNDYKQNSYSVLDSFYQAVGGRQYFYLWSPDRYVSVGYQFERDDPVISNRLVSDGVFTVNEAESFAYTGNEVGASVGAAFPADVTAQLSYAYRHERYAEASATTNPSGSRRSDNEQVVIPAVRKQLGEHLAATAACLIDLNGSTNPEFEYNRYVGSITLEVRF